MLKLLPLQVLLHLIVLFVAETRWDNDTQLSKNPGC